MKRNVTVEICAAAAPNRIEPWVDIQAFLCGWCLQSSKMNRIHHLNSANNMKRGRKDVLPFYCHHASQVVTPPGGRHELPTYLLFSRKYCVNKRLSHQLYSLILFHMPSHMLDATKRYYPQLAEPMTTTKLETFSESQKYVQNFFCQHATLTTTLFSFYKNIYQKPEAGLLIQ